MSIRKPTQHEWDSCINVLQAWLDHTKETEPYATSFIERLQELLEQDMPADVDEAFG